MCVPVVCKVCIKHCRSHKLPRWSMYACMYSRIAHTQVGANHRRANAAGTAQSVSSKLACGPATYVCTFCRLGWSLAKACGLYTSGLTVSRNTSICGCEGKKTHIRTWYIQYIRKYVRTYSQGFTASKLEETVGFGTDL